MGAHSSIDYSAISTLPSQHSLSSSSSSLITALINSSSMMSSNLSTPLSSMWFPQESGAIYQHHHQQQQHLPTVTSTPSSSFSPNELVDDPKLYAQNILIGLFYGTAFITGILGNGLIIYIVAHFHRMRTLSNVFLASLAFADLLLVLVCIPPKFVQLITYTWDFGDFLCKFLHYVQNLSAFCSVMTLTTMSIERYYAIIHPVKCRTTFSMRHIQKIICVIWLLAAILAIPAFFVYIQVRVGDGLPGIYYWCVKVDSQWTSSSTVAKHWARIRLLYECYQIVMILVVPALIMTFAYSKICVRLWTVVHRRTAMRYGNATCHFVTSGSTPNTTTTTTTTNNTAPTAATAHIISVVDQHKPQFTTELVSSQTASEVTSIQSHRRSSETVPIPSQASPTFPARPCSMLSGVNYKQQQTTEEDNQTVKQVIKMLVAVVVVYVICWAPLLIVSMLRALDMIPEINEDLLKQFVPVVFLLQYLNSVINPFIYGFMSKNFRLYFKQTLCQIGYWSIDQALRVRHLLATGHSQSDEPNVQHRNHRSHQKQHHRPHYNSHQFGPQFQQMILMQQQRRQSAEAANASNNININSNSNNKPGAGVAPLSTVSCSKPLALFVDSPPTKDSFIVVDASIQLEEKFRVPRQVSQLSQRPLEEEEEEVEFEDSSDFELDPDCLPPKSRCSFRHNNNNNNNQTVSSVSSSGSSSGPQSSRVTTTGSTGTTTTTGSAGPDDDTESGW